MEYPIRKTKEDRVEFIALTLEKLKNKYSDKLLAFGAYGSIYRDDDRDFSDVDLMAVIEGKEVEEAFEGIYKGLKWELDVVSLDHALKDIRQVEIDWPLYVGIYLNIKPVFDRADIFPILRSEFEKVTSQDFKPYVKAVFTDDIYEQFLKFFNVAENGNEKQLRYLTFHLFTKVTGFLGVVNKSYFGNIASRAEDAIALPINFPSFQKMGNCLLSGNLEDVDKIKEIARKLFQEILAFVDQQGIEFDSDRL